MTAPKRIQMTRRPGGWRKDHPDAVIVARPSKWGNPYAIQRGSAAGRFDIIGPDSSHVATVTGGGVEHAREVAVDLFRLKAAPTLDVTELAGRDLACWCPLEDGHGNRVPCHADVLLELANPGWTP
jgi:hypothetical protein